MRAIVLEGPRKFKVVERSRPEPGRGEALVRIEKVGICGSDIHLFRSGRIGDAAVTRPMPIGHECMGTVQGVGPGADEALVGRRVAVEPTRHCGECQWCRTGRQNCCPNLTFVGLPPTPGAFQEYIAHPASLLEPLPDHVTDAAGVVLEPMAIALHAVNLAKVRPGMRVAILGTGVLGTCVLELLRMTRGLRVACVDLLGDRLARAEDMGAEVVQAREGEPEEACAEVLVALEGEYADAVFECSGSGDTLWNMAEVAAPAGHVAVIGTSPTDQVAFCSATARRKGLTIRMVRRSLNTLPTCIDLADRGVIDAEKLVTHDLPASELTEAFELVDDYADGVLKAVVDMREWANREGVG
jgi:L-iditol 2-dehydrogenase